MARGSSGSDEGSETFIGHLDVFRTHLIRSVAVLFILSFLSFWFKDIVFDTIILGPRRSDFISNRLLCSIGRFLLQSDVLCINQTHFLMINVELPGQFRAHLWVSFLGGFMVSFPYILWELWRFIKPALSQTELRHTNGILFYASFSFIAGAAFGYFLILPLTLNFLSNYTISNQLENHITIQSFLSLFSTIVFATGAVFELPLLVYFLSKMGLVSPRLLTTYRKHAVVGIFIVAGIITPPDVFSQLLVSVPLFFLYQLGIAISKNVYAKKP